MLSFFFIYNILPRFDNKVNRQMVGIQMDGCKLCSSHFCNAIIAN